MATMLSQKYSLNVLKELLTCLLWVDSTRQRGDLRHAICHSIRCKLRRDGPLENINSLTFQAPLTDLFTGWPKHSGHEFFPVPGSEYDYGFEVQEGTVWDNPLRIELLHYSIATLQKEIGEMNKMTTHPVDIEAQRAFEGNLKVDGRKDA